MDLFIYILFAVIAVLCGVVYVSLRKLRRLSNPQPLLGVVTPKTAQNAPQSTKPSRKGK